MKLPAFLSLSLGDETTWPKPLHLIQGLLRVNGGMPLSEAARSVGTTGSILGKIANETDPIAAVLGISDADIPTSAIEKVRKNVGQMLLGRAAEIAFEDIYRSEAAPSEFELSDLREGRSNTDYIVLNGGGRRLFRLNIKFFGSVFRRGAEMVGLESNDCFPLATYKIQAALTRQEAEHVPYIFAIVGVPDLNALAVGHVIPSEQLAPLALLFASKKVARKRDFEDRFVERIVADRSKAFLETYGRIRSADWYILSARRAFNLMRDHLFERVYALRVPGFTRQFSAAEVDMHFSLSEDLIPLKKFLHVLRQDGQTIVASMLERGSF